MMVTTQDEVAVGMLPQTPATLLVAIPVPVPAGHAGDQRKVRDHRAVRGVEVRGLIQPEHVRQPMHDAFSLAPS